MEWSSDWSNAVFSIEERDRRWAKVRELMRKAGVDVIVALPCTNAHDRGQQDSRYLTQLGENSEETTVVFPLDGDVAAWHSRGGVWPSSNWFDTVRATRRGTGGKASIEYLNEIGFKRGSIAVAGLTSSILAHVRAIEGEANWQSVEMIKEAFPDCNVVSATPILGEARYQKSADEIEFLRKGTEVGEITVEAARETLRPGVPERHVFAEMLRAYTDAGGTLQPMYGWISGPLGHTYHRVEQPTFRNIEAGDVIALEVEGRWGGYISQLDSTFYIGKAPKDLKDGMSLAIDVFQEVLEATKPGVTIGELLKLGNKTAMGGRARSRLSMHGRGTGDDGPLATGNVTKEIAEIEVQEGCCFILKPSVWVDDVPDYGRWGDTVVVGSGGAQRLGKRQPVLYECE